MTGKTETIAEDPIFVISKTCAICKHPGCVEANQHYILSGEDEHSLIDFFKTKYKKKFSDSTIKRHIRDRA